MDIRNADPALLYILKFCGMFLIVLGLYKSYDGLHSYIYLKNFEMPHFSPVLGEYNEKSAWVTCNFSRGF